MGNNEKDPVNELAECLGGFIVRHTKEERKLIARKEVDRCWQIFAEYVLSRRLHQYEDERDKLKRYVFKDYRIAAVRMYYKSTMCWVERRETKFVLKFLVGPSMNIILNNRLKTLMPIRLQWREWSRDSLWEEDYYMRPRKLHEVFAKIPSMLMDCSKLLENYDMKLVLPQGLASNYKSHVATRDRYCSGWDDGSHTYGYEIRLSVSDKHDYILAFMASDIDSMKSVSCIFKDAEKAFRLMKSIEDLLPANVRLESEDTDDFGVRITREDEDLNNDLGMLLSDEIYYARPITLEMISDENRFNIRNKTYSKREILEMHRENLKMRNETKPVLEENLKQFKDISSYRERFNHYYVYLATHKGEYYGRTNYLVIPHDADFSFLTHLRKIKEVSDKLEKLFCKKSYYNTTSVALVSVK